VTDDRGRQIIKLERLLSEAADLASEMDLKDVLKPGALRHWLMAAKLNHRITPEGPLDAKDRTGRPVEYLIRESNSARWQLTSLLAGDDRGLNRILDRLSQAKGGIFFGVFRQIGLIRAVRLPPDPVIAEFRDLFKRTREFKKERASPRRRVTLSIGNSFFEGREDVEMVFSSQGRQ